MDRQQSYEQLPETVRRHVTQDGQLISVSLPGGTRTQLSASEISTINVENRRLSLRNGTTYDLQANELRDIEAAWRWATEGEATAGR